MIIAKSRLFFLLLLLSFQNINAQQSVFGKITDSSGEPIFGVSVYVSDEITNKMIYFSVTDENGFYQLNIPKKHEKLILNIRSIGYKEIVKLLTNKHLSQQDFVLKEDIIELNEVVVENTPIEKKGDTLVYNVSSFSSKKDRVLADVLSKMPGIELSPQGHILYQGKSIIKFYVEGLDLLNGKYNLINNNLPFDQVRSVQIIENHQPIKILDGLTYSDRAAINIKLKNKFTKTEAFQLGIGATPLIWENNLTTILFFERLQNLNSYQNNNTGKNIDLELKTLTIEDLLEKVELKNEKKDWLSLKQITPPDFLKKKWLDNNVHLITSNYLKENKNEVQFRLNVSYLNDYQKQEGSTKSFYFTQNDTISIIETINNRLFKEELKTDLNISKNTKKTFFKNNFQFRGNWDRQKGLINPKNNPIDQKLENHYFSATNRFVKIFNYGKHLINFNSILNFNKTPQSLIVNKKTFGGAFLPLRREFKFVKQIVDLKDFDSYHSIDLNKSIGLIKIKPKIGFQLSHKILSTSIYKDNQEVLLENYLNQLKWLNGVAFTELLFQYKKDKWFVELNTPLRFNYFNTYDPNVDRTRYYSKTTFEPSLSLINRLNTSWKIINSMGVRNYFGSIESYYEGYILKNYRTIQRNESILPNYISYHYRTDVNYQNLIKLFFLDFSYKVSHSIHNTILNTQLEENGEIQYKTIEKKNFRNNNSFSINVSQILPKIDSNFSLNLEYSINSLNQIINKEITPLKFERMGASIKLDTELKSWFEIVYEASFNGTKNQINKQKNQLIFNKNHQIDLNFFPVENHFFGIKTEFISNDLISKRKNLFFNDLVYVYTLNDKKIDFEISYNNISNIKNYPLVMVTDSSYFVTDFTLRPSQLLLKTKFSF